MSIDRRAPATTTWEEFSKRTGLHTRSSNSIDRSIFDESELKLYEDYFASLCMDLTIYRQLFGEQKTVDVLNEFSGPIFGRLQCSFVEKICLKIACLMDPATSGRDGAHENMSLKRLVDKANHSQLSSAYKKLSKVYEKTGIKTWRNKILAHTDLETAMGRYSFELKFELKDLVSLIESAQEIVDLIKDPSVQTDVEIVLPFGKDGMSFVSKINSLNMQGKA